MINSSYDIWEIPFMEMTFMERIGLLIVSIVALRYGI